MSGRESIVLRVMRRPSTGEWVVRWTQGAMRIEARCYYTDDRDDAESTARAMAREARAHGFKVTLVGVRDPDLGS